MTAFYDKRQIFSNGFIAAKNKFIDSMGKQETESVFE